MIGVGVILAVVVGLLRGGKLENLSELGLKGLLWVWVALAMRGAVFLLDGRFANAAWLQTAAYVLFLYIIWLNVSQPGIKIFGFGSLLNFLVIAVNGGTMPVSPEAIAAVGMTGRPPSGTHSLMTDSTRLGLLADIIPIRSFYFLPAMAISIGDIIIVMGIFLFIQHRMLAPKACALVLGRE